MEQLVKFTNFLKQRQYAVEDLDRFAELVEPLRTDDGVGYRMKPLAQADRVTQRCEMLLQYTWACRDYVRKILAAQGVADPGVALNAAIRASREIQAVSYLANAFKHGGADPEQQKWAVDLAPRLGKPFVIGQQKSFPHHLKPTFMQWGDSLPAVEFTGRAGIGDEVFEFTEFEWQYSCNVEDKDGNPIGNAWGMCEITFRAWLKVLADHGIAV